MFSIKALFSLALTKWGGVMLNNVFFVSNKILIKNHFSLFTRILSTAKASSCIGKRQSRTVNLRNFNKSKKTF